MVKDEKVQNHQHSVCNALPLASYAYELSEMPLLGFYRNIALSMDLEEDLSLKLSQRFSGLFHADDYC